MSVGRPIFFDPIITTSYFGTPLVLTKGTPKSRIRFTLIKSCVCLCTKYADSHFGTSWPEVVAIVEGSIYALSAGESGLSFAAPCRKSPPAFLPLQTPLPSPAAMAFEVATQTERITHYTLLRKVVCQRVGFAPLWIPPMRLRLANHCRFPAARFCFGLPPNTKAPCPHIRHDAFVLAALRAVLPQAR